MSFDQVPDEVLVTILRLVLISPDALSTSIRAHKIYQTHLGTVATASERPKIDSDEQHHWLHTKLSGPAVRRQLTISPLVIGTCRRWYRLGAPIFYASNSFVVIHREIEAFAQKIGFYILGIFGRLELSFKLMIRRSRPRYPGFVRPTYVKSRLSQL